MADPGVPVFRGGSGSDCEEFVRAIYTYAFEKDKTEDNKWMATYAATRLSGKALRWYARQDNSVKLDWSALQIALLDQYPPSDDEDDVGPNKQLPPKTVPTPAAAAAPSAGVATSAAGSAPVSLVAKKITISECKKARIRVEDTKGTVKGWISINGGPFLSQLTTNPGEALHVKAQADSGGTELRILNVNGWSRLCLLWSASTFNPKNSTQYGHLKPCDAAGVPVKLGIFDVASQTQCLPKVWNLDDAGVITLAWRENGGKDPLYVQPSLSSQFTFYSTGTNRLFGTRESTFKFVYEPIE